MAAKVAGAMIVAGVVLMVISYFFLTAPWGFPPSSEVFSNPRIPFAPGLFIIGSILVFLAAFVYEVLPERRHG
ncbi:MAG: hypothetical protein LN413_01945 [Candidatus Thermoplasmatota archaeon]|nr:hypothetical protein [Candidatus Thermoplasmatota archaeon]